MKEIEELVERLHKLFADPHPGLITWNDAVFNTGKKLRLALQKEGM